MSYLYTAVVQYQDSDGRFVNLTQTATVTAHDLAGNSITGATITNIAIGVYVVSVTQADLEDVVFKVVPAVADQENHNDVAVMQEKVYHVADDIEGKVDIIDGFVDDILVDTSSILPALIEAVNSAVWSYTNRTLTQSATEVIAAVSGSSITQVRGDTWEIELPGLTLDSNLIQFAVKRSKYDSDEESLAFIDTDTGLLYLDGAEGVAGDGSLEYEGTTLWIRLKAAASATLPIGRFVYGAQSVAADGTVVEPYSGEFVILSDAVRAVE